MNKILFDTNIILDIALKREPFFEDSAKLFELIDKNEIVANVSATTITDIYYISKKENGHDESIRFIKDLINVIEIIGIDKEIIINSLNSHFKDFEDAIQSNAAITNEIEVIITRNKNDFKGAQQKIMTPFEYLNKR